MTLVLRASRKAASFGREVIDGLSTRPGRTLLSALSVAMVTAAIVASATIGRSNLGAVTDVFAADTSGFIGARSSDPDTLVLTVEDGERASSTPELVAAATAIRWAGIPIAVHPDRQPTQAFDVLGVAGDPVLAMGIEIAAGRPFDAGHLRRGDHVALVGSSVGDQLDVGPVDGINSILIDGAVYRVIGTFDEAGGDPALTAAILIPRSARPGNERVDTFYALTEPLKVADVARRLSVRLSPASYQNLSVSYRGPSVGLTTAVVNEVQALTRQLLFVGSLVTIVVVGSLATASVAERRREIAIRKALGATSGGIAGRFIAESALVGISGASAGVVLGAVLSVAVTSAKGWVLIPQMGAIPAAVLEGVGASMVGAIWPATRAARLDPADALSKAY